MDEAEGDATRAALRNTAFTRAAPRQRAVEPAQHARAAAAVVQEAAAVVQNAAAAERAAQAAAAAEAHAAMAERERAAAAAAAAAAAEEAAAAAAATEAEAAAAREQRRGLTASALADGGAPCEVSLAYVHACTARFDASRALGTPGAFGAVFRGVDPALGLRFAVKRLSNTAAWPAERSAAREIAILSCFRHPNIIRLWGYTTDVAERCLVYELGMRGALSDALTDDDAALALTWRVRLRVAAGVAAALSYMQRSGPTPAWHRDVKSANVVLTAALEPKLIDCGLSRLLSPEEAARGGLVTATAGLAFGTQGYMCPDYMKRSKYGEPSEVFSFGVLLCELLTGTLQLGGDGGGLDLVDEVAEEEGGLAAARDVRAGAWAPDAAAQTEALAAACVARKPRERPAMLVVLRALNALKQQHATPSAEECLLAEELRDAHAELARLRAADDAAVAQRVLTARQCCLFTACPDGQLALADGLDCGQGHFTCSGCLAAFAADQVAATPAELARRGGRLFCPLRPQGCASPPFSAAALARTLPDDLFLRCNAAEVRAKERELLQEVHTGYEERLRAMERDMAAQRLHNLAAGAVATAAAAIATATAVAQLRAEVVEQVLTLHCPACGQAFVDFSDCFALTCARCAAGFCAWCLAHCGRDAHAHVAGCAHNEAPGRNVWSTTALFATSQRRRRERALRKHLAEQPAHLRAPLLVALARDLEDLGMRAADFEAAAGDDER
jgi:hypothetical protein